MAAASDQGQRDRLPDRWAQRLGWAIAGLTACVLLASAGGKLARTGATLAELGRLGYDADNAVRIGVAQITGAVLYLIPGTGVLGAILITAYMGGGVAAHLIAGDPVGVPVLTAGATWLGLILRDPDVRRVVPWKRRHANAAW